MNFEVRLARLEDRRGESSDEWMRKAGVSDSHYLTEHEVRKRAHFAILGIDPDISYSAQLTRMAELRLGDSRTPEELERLAVIAERMGWTEEQAQAEVGRILAI